MSRAAKPKGAPKPRGEAILARPPIMDRGELGLMLGGELMVLRPSYEAIEAFEQITGRGLLELSRDALTGKLSVGATAQIATECIRAWGRDTDNRDASRAGAPRIAELILDADGGFHTALETLAKMLALAATGGYTSKGELKPATKTKTG